MTGLAESSAKTAWSTLRKKSLAGNEDAIAPKTPGSAAENKKAPAKRKSTGGKKGENGEDVDGGDNAETTAETPSKKPRGRPPKAKVAENDDDDRAMKGGTEAPATTPAKKKPTPRKLAAKKTKAISNTAEAEAEAEATPEAGDDDTEMKDDTAAPTATPAKKKIAPKKPAAARKTKVTSKNPEAEFETGAAPEKAQASPGSAQVGSDDTAHEDGPSITIESSKEIVEVDLTNDKTEVTITEKVVTEKDEGEKGEKATPS